MATIEFRGVMLFVCEEGFVKDVVFPDTRQIPPGGHKVGDEKKFSDGNTAKEHFPGLVHVRADGNEEHHDLRGATVTFLGGRTHVATSMIAALPHLPTVASIPTLVFDPDCERAASISLQLPEVASVCVTAPKARFTLPNWDHPSKEQECPLIVEIGLHGEIAVIVTDDAVQSSILVRANERIVLHHFDKPTPLYSELKKQREIDASETGLTDHDFKWLYSLCEPKPGSSQWSHPSLPAPQWKRPVVAGPTPQVPVVVSVSTCFPARIGA